MIKDNLAKGVESSLDMFPILLTIALVNKSCTHKIEP